MFSWRYSIHKMAPFGGFLGPFSPKYIYIYINIYIYIYIYIYQGYFSNSEETQAPIFTWHHPHESFFQL